MTVTTTIDSFDLNRLGYSGLPEVSRSVTPYPLAELRYDLLQNETITDGDAGGQVVSINLDLPDGYAYAITGFNCAIKNSSGMNFQDLGYAWFDSGAGTLQHMFNVQAPGLTYQQAGDLQKVWQPYEATLPKAVIIPQPSVPPRFRVRLRNLTASDTGYTLTNFLASFLQYTPEQFFHYAVHYPLMTR